MSIFQILLLLTLSSSLIQSFQWQWAETRVIFAKDLQINDVVLPQRFTVNKLDWIEDKVQGQFLIVALTPQHSERTKKYYYGYAWHTNITILKQAHAQPRKHKQNRPQWPQGTRIQKRIQYIYSLTRFLFKNTFHGMRKR